MFLLASCSIPLALYAQSSNLVVKVLLPRYDFLPGSAAYSQTTNLPSLTNLDGYMYPSNFTGITRYEWPPQIITSSNAVVSWNVATTNSNTIVGGFYRLTVYTNNASAPYYDTGEIVWLGVVGPNINSIQTKRITNNFPTDIVAQRTNITQCVFSWRIGPVEGNQFTQWLTGGFIQFQ